VELVTLKDGERYLDGFVNLERREHFDYERLGTRRVAALLEAVGDPQRELPCVHIAGSKGKGSVALAAEALLRAGGRRVGTFTSPHLQSWCERFRIDGRSATEEELLGGLRELMPAAERLRVDPELRPSFFDVCTTLALLLFRRAHVEGAVVEVGLGGRLDSTNLVEPRVSVLTGIQLEHTDKLGGTLEAIAGEKAGILRPRVPLVHGPLPSEALGVVLARAVALDLAVEEVRAREVEVGPLGTAFSMEDGRPIVTSVLGRHQATNVAVALRAAELWLGRPLGEEEVGGLRTLSLPARVERIGRAVLDSAHTPDSARALRETLQAVYPGRPFVTVLSISRDKDAAGILGEIAPVTRRFVLCRSETQRSRDPESLEPLAWACGVEQIEVVPDPAAALESAWQTLEPEELLAVTGSFYLAGRLRPLLLATAEAGLSPASRPAAAKPVRNPD
jgi:dihydrofolate synthase/folylpolyglutamate synthase